MELPRDHIDLSDVGLGKFRLASSKPDQSESAPLEMAQEAYLKLSNDERALFVLWMANVASTPAKVKPKRKGK
jgi:hypothetical protein